MFSFFFFFNATATTEIYTLSLHDALPICTNLPKRYNRDLVVASQLDVSPHGRFLGCRHVGHIFTERGRQIDRSEEHTSELQSRLHLVCRLLLEKKKKKNKNDKREIDTYTI